MVFDLFERTAFGFRNITEGEPQAEYSNNTKYPESISFADMFNQNRECERYQEVEAKISHGADAHCQSADF